MKKLTDRQLLICTFVALTFLVLLVSLLAMRSLCVSNDQFFSFANGTKERERLIYDVRAPAMSKSR